MLISVLRKGSELVGVRLAKKFLFPGGARRAVK
jgi:hypothetical protein